MTLTGRVPNTVETIRLAIYGGGGFGREVWYWAEDCSGPAKRYERIGFIDDSPTIPRQINGNSVFTLADFAAAFPDARVVIAVADPKGREHLAKAVGDAGFGCETLVHPSAIRPQKTAPGIGSIICAGCILTTDIVLGRHVQVNIGTTIGHDVTIGDYSTIGPGVRIAGCVTIGKRVFFGAGAIVINGTASEPLCIGDDSVIGAGSCVIRSLPAGSHVFGNPARPYAHNR